MLEGEPDFVILPEIKDGPDYRVEEDHYLAADERERLHRLEEKNGRRGKVPVDDGPGGFLNEFIAPFIGQLELFKVRRLASPEIQSMLKPRCLFTFLPRGPRRV